MSTEPTAELDPDLLERAARTLIAVRAASTAHLVMELRVRHAVAAALLTRLEELGVIGRSDNPRLARHVLIAPEQAEQAVARIRVGRHATDDAPPDAEATNT